MKRYAFLLLGVILLFGCSQKVEIPQITGWDRFEDPYYEIGFSHPKGWPVSQEGGRFSVYSSQDVMGRFIDFSPEGKDGVRLTVSSQKMETAQSLDEYMNELKKDLTSSGFEIRSTEPRNMGDEPGIQIQYGGAIDNKNSIEAIQVASIRNSDLFSVKYEAFNKLFVPCKAVFDSALVTLQLPKPKVVAPVGEDPSIPSQEFKDFSNKYLKLSYPANFQTSQAQAKAPVEFSMDIKGYRQDSNIHVDVRPSQGLTAEKVVEQNAKNFRETSRGTTVIDGVNTTYINYSPMRDVQSRVYFLVKGDRFYRIIMNYYAPMRSVYLPVFEKAVASIATK